VRKAITSIYRNAPVLIREAARLIGKEIKQAQKQKRRRVYRAVDIPEIARRIGEGNISMGAVYWSYNYGPEDVRSKIDSICRDNQVLIHEAIEFLVQERLRITDTSIAREAGLRLSCINREKKLRPGLREVINAAEEASRTWPKSSRAGVEDLSTDPAPLDDLQEMRNIFVQIDDRLAAVNCHRSYAISMPSTSRVDTPPLRPGHSLQWESSGAKGL
jgi:hypothetical protein